VADAPDLQFCSAHGKTPAQAVAELEIAMLAWLDTALERGIPIPEARYRPPLAG
jgi:predicted RNase H-like HicB family nuclease